MPIRKTTRLIPSHPPRYRHKARQVHHKQKHAKTYTPYLPFGQVICSPIMGLWPILLTRVTGGKRTYHTRNKVKRARECNFATTSTPSTSGDGNLVDYRESPQSLHHARGGALENRPIEIILRSQTAHLHHNLGPRNIAVGIKDGAVPEDGGDIYGCAIRKP